MPLHVSVKGKESQYLFLSMFWPRLEWAVVGAIGAPYGDRIDWNVDDCHYICIAPKAGFCCCEGFYSSRGRVWRGQTSGRPGLQQQCQRCCRVSKESFCVKASQKYH